MKSSRLVWGVIVVVFAAMAVAGPYKMLRNSSQPSSGPAPESGTRVSMAGLAFAPAELMVDRGTEVVFDNDDLAPHTVTADDGGVDSGTINPGKAFRVTIDAPLEYHCAIHPSMTGRVLVRG
jgi:plastocyanin